MHASGASSESGNVPPINARARDRKPEILQPTERGGVVATHFGAKRALRRLKGSDTLPQQDSNGNLAVKLLRTFTARTGALQRSRWNKQAAELGGQVRKGEKGSLVVYANTFTKTGTDEKGAEVETEIPFMKGYTVFNAEQIDGLPAHFYATVTPLNSDITPLDAVERFFASTKITIQHGGSSAFYSPSPRHRANAGATGVSRPRKLLRHPRP